VKRLLFCGPLYFLMIEEIDDDRRRIKGVLHTIVIPAVIQTSPRGILPKLGVQRFPIQTAALVVDFMIQREQIRILFPDIVHDDGSEGATKVQVFQPDQVALILHPLNDRLRIRDAGENRRDETGGADALIVSSSLLISSVLLPIDRTIPMQGTMFSLVQ